MRCNLRSFGSTNGLMMQSFIATLRGSITLTLMTLNVIFWFCPIMLFTLGKIALPWHAAQHLFTALATRCAEFWCYSNRVIFATMLNVRWDIRNHAQLAARDWYLVIANHQSWVDILALQQALTGHIPFLKFFIKQSLIWVPFLGQAWWALDMPFMKRYSREQIARQPELRGKDLETTRKACAHFSQLPTSVFNFVEGTRFTTAKHQATASPYRYLLQPRAGGIAFTLGSMGTILRRLLDVTIVYPDKPGTLWDLCCGRLHHIIIDIRERPLEAWINQGNYLDDEAYRERFQQWLSTLWQEKDERIASIQHTPAPHSKPR